MQAGAEGGLPDHHRLRPHRAVPGRAARGVQGGKAASDNNIPFSLPAVLIYKTFPPPFPLTTPPLEFPIYFRRLQVPQKRDVL